MKTFLGIVALILLLASCGGSDSGSASTRQPAPTEPLEETASGSTPAAEPTELPQPTPALEPLDLVKSIAALESFEDDYADAITAGGLVFYTFAAEHAWPRGAWTPADIRCNYALNVEVYDDGDASYAYRNFTLLEPTQSWSPSNASGQPGAGQVPGEGTFLASVDYLDQENLTAHVHIDTDYHVSLFPNGGCVDATMTKAEALELINHSPFDTAIAIDGHLMMFNLDDADRFALALSSGRVISSQDGLRTIAECTDGNFEHTEGVRDPCDEIPERELETQLLTVSEEVADLQSCLDVGLCFILESWRSPFSFRDLDDLPTPGSDSDDGWEFLTALSARVIEENVDMDPEVGTLSSGLHSDGAMRFTLALNGPDSLMKASEIAFLEGFLPGMTDITESTVSLSLTVERVQVTGSRTGTVYICTMEEITAEDWSTCLRDPDGPSVDANQTDPDELYYNVVELIFPGTSQSDADLLRTQICRLVRIAGLDTAITELQQDSGMGAENVELIVSAGVLSKCPEELE